MLRHIKRGQLRWNADTIAANPNSFHPIVIIGLLVSRTTFFYFAPRLIVASHFVMLHDLVFSQKIQILLYN
jgi:hypothetical protein